jgi:3-phytase
MAVFSKYPIDMAGVRTFQHFLWRDMPGALLPSRYTAEEIKILRLSSKSHWDVPITIGQATAHFLVSHPTPPAGDGSVNDLRQRNYDEIRFWADYVDPAKNGYFYDDQGQRGGLPAGATFVIAGDQNADPHDGGSLPGAARQLTKHPLINNSKIPSSPGAAEQAALQGLANTLHKGEPVHDTADFGDGSAEDFETAPGNLRVDYVLPSKNLTILDCGVFWPETADPLFALVGVDPFPASDHRLVWVDVEI